MHGANERLDAREISLVSIENVLCFGLYSIDSKEFTHQKNGAGTLVCPCDVCKRVAQHSYKKRKVDVIGAAQGRHRY